MMGDLVTGLDLGGTKISAALAQSDGTVVQALVVPTDAAEGPDRVIRRMAGAVRTLLRDSAATPSDLARVGVGAPGPVDSQRGMVWTAPNLPGWSEIPLADLLSKSLGVPVSLDNDAHVAALAEHRCGAGRGVDNMVYMTLGTGVGGGIILNGELYRGPSESAGEIGHMVLDPDGPACAAGHRGCLESLASGPALAREARRRLQESPGGLLWDLCDGNPLQVTPPEVAAAALKGDPLAQEVIADAARRIGQAIASLAAVLNPQRVVIGGGTARMGETLLEPVRAAVREMGFGRAAQQLEIVHGELGHQAGLFGALLLALESHQQRRAAINWKAS